MGGFLLIRKDAKTHQSNVEKKYSKSIDIFKKKGLDLSAKIDTNKFVIYLYHKYCVKTENIYVFPNNDFIISVGTCIYNKKIGIDSIKELFEDFSEGKNINIGLNGNYTIIIFRNDKLYILNDYLGLYRIYTNKTKTVLSNSFLAVSRAITKKNISSQEIYEYIFQGAFYGDKTIYKEIKLLSSQYLWQISPELTKTEKDFDFNFNQTSSNLNDLVTKTSKSHLDYFNMLKNTFGNKITSALSGGYDSRLMLALMKNVDILPKLYVYGENNSNDVKVAKTITEGENLLLDHVNRSEYDRIEIQSFRSILENNFYCFDGLGIKGVFDNGSDINTRIKRYEDMLLQLNGGGGEIYRNFWNLPNKRYSIRNFLKSKYEPLDLIKICTEHFNKNQYYSNFENKIKIILSTDKDSLSRKQIEMLYPFLRLKYWMGMNNSINNQFGYAITPYVEPEFVYKSFNIPLKYKNLGLFQSLLIRNTDEGLSKYYSDYGFTFYDKINRKRKIKGFIKRNIPISLRPLIRRKLSKNKNEIKPYYLQDEYLNEIFNLDNLEIYKYINVKQIKDPEVLSRALSIELLITDEF